MRVLNEEITRRSQDFAARWGFLTRDLFFNFLCPMSRAQQYRYWNALLSNGFFIASRADSNVLQLSQKSRTIMKDSARPARLPGYIEHDSHVARFYLILEQIGILGQSWTEDELMRDRLQAFHVLGAERLNRIPDLVFDLKTATGTLRCALEIEKTTKSKDRYQRLANAYLDYGKIDLMLFGCGSLTTESAVRRAFQGRSFVAKQKIPARFLYEDLRLSGISARIRIDESEYTLREFLSIVTKRPIENSNAKRERNENSFSVRNPKIAEAA